ncbi:MAG: hypothetical protein AB8G22_20560 [Saprospiraceae bacterium]
MTVLHSSNWYTQWLVLLVCIISIGQQLNAQIATLEKAVDLTSATSGDFLKYSLEYGCSSLDSDCLGAILIDTLPPEVSFSAAYCCNCGRKWRNIRD